MKFAELASEVQVQRSVVRGGQAPGLAPGRRRANLLFREVRRNMMTEGLAKAKVSHSYQDKAVASHLPSSLI